MEPSAPALGVSAQHYTTCAFGVSAQQPTLDVSEQHYTAFGFGVSAEQPALHVSAVHSTTLGLCVSVDENVMGVSAEHCTALRSGVSVEQHALSVPVEHTATPIVASLKGIDPHLEVLHAEPSELHAFTGKDSFVQEANSLCLNITNMIAKNKRITSDEQGQAQRDNKRLTVEKQTISNDFERYKLQQEEINSQTLLDKQVLEAEKQRALEAYQRMQQENATTGQKCLHMERMLQNVQDSLERKDGGIARLQSTGLLGVELAVHVEKIHREKLELEHKYDEQVNHNQLLTSRISAAMAALRGGDPRHEAAVQNAGREVARNFTQLWLLVQPYLPVDDSAVRTDGSAGTGSAGTVCANPFQDSANPPSLPSHGEGAFSDPPPPPAIACQHTL